MKLICVHVVRFLVLITAGVWGLDCFFPVKVPVLFIYTRFKTAQKSESCVPWKNINLGQIITSPIVEYVFQQIPT